MKPSQPSSAEAWPTLAGRIVEGRHLLPVRIYYEDTDFSGNVYHAGYLRFMERGRTDYLRCLGISHTELAAGEGRLGFVVSRVEVDFIRPARLDDLVVVESQFLPGRGLRMAIDQRVMRKGETLAAGIVTVVLVDGSGRPRRPPRHLAETLKAAAGQPTAG